MMQQKAGNTVQEKSLALCVCGCASVLVTKIESSYDRQRLEKRNKRILHYCICEYFFTVFALLLEVIQKYL